MNFAIYFVVPRTEAALVAFAKISLRAAVDAAAAFRKSSLASMLVVSAEFVSIAGTVVLPWATKAVMAGVDETRNDHAVGVVKIEFNWAAVRRPAEERAEGSREA
jgi:hypothetical protein